MDNIKFKELGLNEKVLRAIDDMGFEEPSKIQEKVIPILLSGNDVIGQAQTGTGKTLAFGAPVLSNMGEGNHIKCLILAPTRELAVQVNDELARIGKHSGRRILPVYGGQPIDRQMRAIRRGVDLIVGTPGRVLDLIKRNVIDLSKIEFLVLDEADEMLNMGFIDDIEAILKDANKDRQTLLFSATMPAEIKKLASKYMKRDAQQVTIARKTITGANVTQFYFEVKHRDRFETLCRVLDVDEPTAAIIFCKTKRGVDEVVELMQQRGYNVEGMHGDMTQTHRMNTLRKFKEGNLEFLVATDVAARGIDVENVTHVINYDLPQDTESYVHRIGRTGRANREGTAYTLVTAREYMTLKQIERVTKGKIKRKEIPTVDDIFMAKYKNIIEKVEKTLSEDNFKKFVPMVQELDEEHNLVDVAAALMSMVYNKEVSFDYTQNTLETTSGGYGNSNNGGNYRNSNSGGNYRNSNSGGNYRSSGNGDNVRLFMSVGRMDSADPKSLLQLFNTMDIYKEDIGNIDIFDKFTFVNVTERVVDKLIRECDGKRMNGRRIRIEVAKGKNE